MSEDGYWVCELCYIPVRCKNNGYGRVRMLFHSLSHPFLTVRYLLRSGLVGELEDNSQKGGETE